MTMTVISGSWITSPQICCINIQNFLRTCTGENSETRAQTLVRLISLRLECFENDTFSPFVTGMDTMGRPAPTKMGVSGCHGLGSNQV